MSGINNYCFTDLPPHEQVLCNAYLKCGIDSLGLIEIDAAIASYSSEANWNTALQQVTLVLSKASSANFQTVQQ